MSRITVVFILLSVSGCGPFIDSPVSRDPKQSIVDDRASATDIWHALANAVEKGSIPTSQRLAQFVVVLARHGDLSATDVAKFDAVFEDAAKSDRTLEADDAKRLREIRN
jgi:hypothetical protein